MRKSCGSRSDEQNWGRELEMSAVKVVDLSGKMELLTKSKTKQHKSQEILPSV